MKNVVTSIIAALLCSLSISAKEVKEEISKDQLPALSLAFISQNFASAPVIRAVKETEGEKVEFEVYLKGGTELTFAKKGKWKEVDCKATAVPDAIIPKEIKTAVSAKYPGSVIVKIERKKSKWKVELNDGTDIDFDSKFQITKTDR